MTTESWTLDRDVWLALAPYIDDALAQQTTMAAELLRAAIAAGDVRVVAGIDERLDPALEVRVQVARRVHRLCMVPIAAVGASEDDWSRVVDAELSDGAA